ncbi:MAG TPA: LuxR C-terminal-related transcriptional regulator [Candidatus Nitrosotenuis sp.]|nr:LuxR C-terminal-related transcriptional regulator [Candidatus Nitrosotenuis sp.]
MALYVFGQSKQSRTGARPATKAPAWPISAEREAAPSPELEPSHGLSCEQMSTLELATQGLSSKEIGQRCYVSEDTVKSRLRKIFQKLNVKNREQAAAAALRQGYIRLEKTPQPRGALSQRELEIVTLLGQGLENDEIAQELGITKLTVKSHLARISRKLNTKGRTQIFVTCWRNEWVT